MERITSGIEELDPLLEGGYPKGKGILITGSTGSGKTIMGIHFLYSNCSSGKKGLLVLTRELLEDVLLQAKTLGMDLEPFIDSGMLVVENIFQSRIQEAMLSSRLGKGLELAEKDRVGRIKILSENADAVVLDSLAALSSLQKCPGNEPLSKFGLIYSVLAEHKCTSLFLMDESMHNRVHGFADNLVFGKIELKLKEDSASGKLSRSLSVTKMRATKSPPGNVLFELTSSGIRIK
ncbi:resolvase [Methanosarcina sp. KYL-1]|uniref:RAD55 family ATPase n=1 Tax=Methanosarcina sp. KYL-1 TaxID=2602068 RepID=UPI0021014CA2|nr:ATPase domain-containing protein [Methanosarcina sp. KYL-1]MCQ1534700.1 resolvase [Methanosarcina sp. KYL-1]